MIAAVLLLLTGCVTEDTFETIADEAVEPVMAVPRETSVMLPEEAAAPVLQNDERQIYLGENYQLILERYPSGDLGKTIRSVSGFEREALTLLKTEQDAGERYEFVWVSAGETGELLGRAAILDDGHYHYCMSVLRTQETDAAVWEQVFASFRLV